ncbi:hypothetical protein DNJ95_12680 [Stutzerimonas kirkiae]|uniref:Glycosyl hydrolase family 32 N-terminal domain-containing protein n=1 Tax=Stutzerimonas kirkiae TaxID=2211392 RepID=A0A4Q9R1L8_9GAMM|nr:hypothetical protein [Stutzerimonas kirkiae]TBU92863.1 hypothetical protein DNJ96_14735 [Stutzerimonas kirkiae]TBV01326.1 hypothetical protein DNJ95_12680 [Stutzerimonas kirkiae]
MSESWQKLGQLYLPASTGRHPKLLTHAANPLAVQLDGDVYRVFYSGRDAYNRSSVGAVDIDIVRRAIVTDHHQPFFEHGPVGSFYADGVSIGNCYTVGDTRYMLFMAWQAPEGSHWRGDIGRLTLGADLSLALDGDCPLLGVDANDPISLSYPWVEQDPDGRYRMWYGSTVAWDAGNGEMLHVIRQATSEDGHRWQREGLAVPYEEGRAQAFSRPSVMRNAEGGYEMWFSYRGGKGQAYRIGHATSPDGRHWRLSLETAGIDVSVRGWDAQMIEYPFVFDHAGVRYMLYNGNSYGRTGFGLAMLRDG